METDACLSLTEAKELLAGLSDRDLVRAVIRLREARGLKGYGADHARRTKAQKLYDAQQAATELADYDLGLLSRSLVLGGAEPKKFALDSAEPHMVDAGAETYLTEDGREYTREVPPIEPSDALEAAKALIQALSAQKQAPAVDKHEVEAIVRRLLDEHGTTPRVIELRQPGRESVHISGAHWLAEKVYRNVRLGQNVLLVGPAGCGKTYLGESLADMDQARRFGSLSCSAGTTESALVGRLLPVRAGGTFAYLPSAFVDIYENGGVFLFDELDAADPNMLLVINSALANGHIEIEQRSAGDKDGNELASRITRHERCILVAAANTFGTGANAQYVGRGALDAATLDRWYVIELDYDLSFEASLFGGTAPKRAPWEAASDDEAKVRADIAILGAWVWDVREKAQATGLRRVVSSRMIQKGKLARMAGVALAEIKSDLLAGWSEDEKRAIGVGVC
jgi:cobaltochelatase CobS